MTGPRILYAVGDGAYTGGNVVCLQLIDEALARGWVPIVASGTDGPFCDAVRQRGCEVAVIDLRRSFYWPAAVRLARLLRTRRVELVHTHASFAGSMLAAAAGRLAGVPVIMHAHARDPLHPSPIVRAYQLALMRWVTRVCCASVIAVSEQVRDEFVAQGVDRRKISVIYNGIEADAWGNGHGSAVRAALRLAPDRPVIVHVGRLCATKGQHLLIRAVPAIRQQHGDTTVLFVGEDLAEGGAYRRTLEALARSLRVEDRVVFLGQRFDIPDLLAAADLIALPSSAEGLPIVLLEGMAAARPVVATRIGGVPELVVDGETGLLIPPGDVGRLAAAIGRLLDDRESARAMGRQGRHRVREQFTLRRMLDQHFAVYETLLS